MKKFIIVSVLTILSVICLCGSNRVKIPLKHIKETDKEYVVFASGVSSNANTATSIAQNECYGQMARRLNADVKSGLETYAQNYQMKSGKKIKIDDGSVAESVTTTLSKAKITKMKQVDYSLVYDKRKGIYTCWVAMSLPKDVGNEIIDGYKSSIEFEIDDVNKQRINDDREDFKHRIGYENDVGYFN